MTLQELKKIIQTKYLHHAPEDIKCKCNMYARWEPKLPGDLCQLCNHSFADHEGYGACTFVTKGDFTLSSGAKSDKYFDIKGLLGNYVDCITLMDSLESLYFGESTGLWRASPEGRIFNSVGGTELGGALIVAMMQYRWQINSCFIRKQQRIHGLKKMIEGVPRSPILLVDDVISTGHTIRDAISTCYNPANGFTVAGVLCVINRSGKESINANELFVEVKGWPTPTWPIYSLFKESDFDS